MNTHQSAHVAGSTHHLDETVAIVTGGASGIGRAIVKQLVSEGAKVAIFDINEVASRHVAEEAADRCIAISGDNRDGAAVAAAVRDVEEQLGPVSVLIQSAGVADACPGDRLDADAWYRTIDINLTGAFHFLDACIPGMMERRYGRILHIASVAGIRGGQNRSVAYAASKGGLIAMTRALAAQLGPYGITVNSLSPGIVRTELTTELLSSIPEEALRTAIPLGHEATPDDIASAALFLVGPRGGYVNAVDLVVDGGLINTYRV